MNTIEVIQAAHAKLTVLRDGSTPGPWEVSRYQGDQEINAPMGDGQWTAVVDFYKKDSTDPELIVALHATIDAQLAILQSTLDEYARWGDRVGRDGVDYDGHVRKLALSILEAS